MQIADGTVVAMDYALKDDEGTLIDQSQQGQPLVYLHGHRNIIPGLEAALVGKQAGDSAEVRVDPANGYGEPNPALEQIVPKDRFQGVEDLQAGMQFQANTDQGPVSVRVVKVEGDEVTVAHRIVGTALPRPKACDQLLGLMERGKPETLVVIYLPQRRTSAKAPGPGSLLKKSVCEDWSRMAEGLTCDYPHRQC